MSDPVPRQVQIVGRVDALRRYPVKSMLGEEVQEAEFVPRRMLGDRAYALVDQETGKVASAKRPHLWRKLLACEAETLPGSAPGGDEPPIRITLPDGRTFLSTDPGLNEALSDLFGRRVSLVAGAMPGAEIDRADTEEVLRRGADADVSFTVGKLGGAAPEATLFNYAPVHRITTATLSRLAALSSRGRAEAERFRPNIVIDTMEVTGRFVENEWVDSTIDSPSPAAANRPASASMPKSCARGVLLTGMRSICCRISEPGQRSYSRRLQG